jgi:hypothetical protein
MGGAEQMPAQGGAPMPQPENPNAGLPAGVQGAMNIAQNAG